MELLRAVALGGELLEKLAYCYFPVSDSPHVPQSTRRLLAAPRRPAHCSTAERARFLAGASGCFCLQHVGGARLQEKSDALLLQYSTCTGFCSTDTVGAALPYRRSSSRLRTSKYRAVV